MSTHDLPSMRDALDLKVNQVFAGKVVHKDLVRKIKSGANVPVFVLEYLLGKYCASADELTIQMGMQVVKDILANNYIRPDEAIKAQSRVKEEGRYTFIDKVKVRLVDSDYWASANNFGHNFIHVPTQYVRDYERLLTGGIWAQVELLVLGDMSVQGNIKPLPSLVEPLQVAMDNGARRALAPSGNKRNFFEVNASILEHVDPIFYGDPKTAAYKALGLT